MPTETPSDVITRGLCDAVEVRGIDEESRTATFVAATEGGVETWAGREHLRMNGADLSRYKRNPTILDTHNRYEARAVIGKAVSVKIEKRELIVEIEFAETERAEEVWKLVRGKFLRALSIGFFAREVQQLQEGEHSGNGQNRVEGPARVVKRWELFEVSIVPVGADPDALRRSLLQGEPGAMELLAREVAQLLGRNGGGSEMTTKTETPEADQRSEDAADPGQSNPTPEARSAADPPDSPPVGTMTAEETRCRDIRAMCPTGMENVASRCVLEGLSVEDARKRMLEEHTKRCPPVGTPEPEKPESKAGDESTRKLEDVSDDELVRGLCG